ncbi:predicted protein [Chaetoceros tenuissimus]|uniref:Uncharacterized protein n=1 Tax=Chaetoceros tenuissimus TaxID=426638 RepID=A0AAD3CTF3_9STRA|nr:predicted protein [Chaetoceros tenuissimus]
MFGTKSKDNMVYQSNRRKKQNSFLPPKEVKFSSVKVRSTKRTENRTPFAGLDNNIFSESQSFENFNVDTEDFDYMTLMHRGRDDGSVFSAVDDNHGFDRYKSIYSPKNSASHRRSNRDADLSNTLVNPLHREPPRFQRMTAKEYMKSVPNRERNMLSMKERLERDILDTIGGMGEDENGNIVYKPRSASLILKSNNFNFGGEVVAPKHKKDKLMSPLRKYKSLADTTSTNSYIASEEMNKLNYLEKKKKKKKSSFDVLMDEEIVEDYDGIQSMRSGLQNAADLDYITSKTWSPKRIIASLSPKRAMNQLRSPRNGKIVQSEDTEEHDEIQTMRSTSYEEGGHKNQKMVKVKVSPTRDRRQKYKVERDTKIKGKPDYIWTFASSDSHSTDGTSTIGSSITGSMRSTDTNFEGCVNGLQRELRDLKILQRTVYDQIDKQCKNVNFPELKCKGVKMGKMKLKAVRCNGTGRAKMDQSRDGPSPATPKSSTAIEDGSMKDIEERKVCSPISPTNYQDISSSLMELAKLKPIYPALAENKKNNEVEEKEEDEKSLVKDKKKKRRVVGMLKKVKAAVNNGVQRKKAKSGEKQMPSKEEEEEVEETVVSKNHGTSESNTYAMKWSRLPGLLSKQKEVQQKEEQEVQESAVLETEEPNGNNFSPMKWPRLPQILSPTQQKVEEQEGDGSFVPDENKQTNHESNESPTKWPRLPTMLSLTSPISHAPTKASKEMPLSPPAMFHE